MTRILSWVLIGLISTGCSSPAVKTNFYTLNKHTVESNLIETSQGLKLITIESIDLADYLRQQGIVVKESNSKLQISNNHRWAESLDGALARNLRGNLESRIDDFRIELVDRNWQKQAFLRVKLEITQFEIDNSIGRAVHAGRYWIQNDGGQVIAQRRFNLTNELSQNGFEHAVERLQQTVYQLGEMLAKDIQEISKSPN